MVSFGRVTGEGEVVVGEEVKGAEEEVESFVGADGAEEQEPLGGEALVEAWRVETVGICPDTVRDDMNGRPPGPEKIRQFTGEPWRMNE
jgi:hypothetical protein